MADTVRYLMEAMIPELEDFQKRGYFTKPELREIVRKREKFEYLLKRKAARKDDYIRYVEYEQKLEQLRVLRKRKLQIKGKQTTADHAIVKRIHFILQRATRKFQADLQLWLMWLDFCKQSDSGKLFSKVATRALRLHPNCAALWSLAAAWEFEHNGNASAARLLLQQGLRMCKHEPALWVEYFHMELMYVRKLRARRKVLGLDVPGKKATPVQEAELKDASGPDIMLTEEVAVAPGPSSSSADNTEAASAVEAVLKGAVALVVVRNALQAFPQDLGLCKRLLGVAADFKFPGMRAIKESIYSALQSQFSNVEEAWDLLARRHSHHEAAVHGADFDACCAVYEEAVQKLPTCKMIHLFANFLHQVLKEYMTDPSQVESAAVVAKKLLSILKQAHQTGIADVDIYLLWHSVAQLLQQPKISLTALRHGCQRHPSSTALWTARIQQEAIAAGLTLGSPQTDISPTPSSYKEDGTLRSGVSLGPKAKKQKLEAAGVDVGANGKAENGDVVNGDVIGAHGAHGVRERVESKKGTQLLQGAVREALVKVAPHDGAGVWKQALEVMGGSPPDMEQLQGLLLHTLMSCSKGPLRGGLGHVAGLFLKSIYRHAGLDAARKLFGVLLKVPCAGGEMFHMMVDLEEAALTEAKAAGGKASSKHLKGVFEAAVAAYGQSDIDLWLRYADWAATQATGGGDVYWRATKALADSDEFVEKFRQLHELE